MKKNTHRDKGQRPWSKLGRDIRALFAPKLPIQIHCSVLPLKSKEAIGSTRFPRYWITLRKEIIFDYPAHFMNLIDHEARSWETKRADPQGCITVGKSYPYERHNVSEISNLIREYIDRLKESLFDPFESDRWGLVEILRAADRRIGKRRLLEMQTNNQGAQKIVSIRLNQENYIKETNNEK